MFGVGGGRGEVGMASPWIGPTGFGGLGRMRGGVPFFLQVPVNSFRRVASLANGPNNQRGAPLDIPGGKDPFDAGHLVGIDRNVASCIQPDPECVQQAFLYRTGEAHGEQDEIRRNLKVSSGYLDETRTSVSVGPELNTHGMKARHLLFIPEEPFGGDAPSAHTPFLVGVGGPEHQGPQRPRSTL